ncbi:MAG: hypothetical protein KJ630_08925 [Proteobacteria bacterium]|nr:hypothetical protein [Pseudomonadota bacterium]
MKKSPCRSPIFGCHRGAALLIMMLLLFVAAMTVILRGLGGGNLKEQEAAATSEALAKVKDSVIAFAVMYADNYPAGAGVGHLMCPDTDAPAFDATGIPLAPYGVANSPCGPNAIGRLPHYVTLPSGKPFPLSDHGSGVDRQFWYAVADRALANPAGGLSNIFNSATPGTLSLDGQGDIVAVIIAPGPPFGGQNRPGTSPAAYLEAGNALGPAFVTGWPANPQNFNDRVLAVKRSELLLPMTARVVEEMKKHLDAYHVAGGAYPADQAAFAGAFAAAPPWLAANQWLQATVTTYTPLSGNSVTLAFAGCGITYTLTFGSATIGRSQTHC